MYEPPQGSDGALDPDPNEEEPASGVDNVIPTRVYRGVRVIELGGSAGSIPALRHFFQATPTNSGMAFVVVLHLSPEHESGLSEVLQGAATMAVTEARDGERVQANQVYVDSTRKGAFVERWPPTRVRVAVPIQSGLG